MRPETILLFDKDSTKYIECVFRLVHTNHTNPRAWVGIATPISTEDPFEVPVVVYKDGTIFTSSDWQASVQDEWLKDLEEARYLISWVENKSGIPAILFEGLPRLLFTQVVGG